jgi:hypothetical protein
MNQVTVIVFICIVVLLIAKVAFDIREKYTSYLDHKSKCFDCEKDMIQRCGEKCAWMAQPAKSYDAEREAVLQYGGDISGGYLAKTLKYY